jgi:hypothetical protein
LLPVLRRRGGIRNADLVGETEISRGTANRLLKDWSLAGWLVKPNKRGLGAIYTPGPLLLHQSQIASEIREGDAISPEDDAIKR